MHLHGTNHGARYKAGLEVGANAKPRRMTFRQRIADIVGAIRELLRLMEETP